MNIGQVFLELLADGARFKQSVEEEARKAGDAASRTLGQRISAGLATAGKAMASVGKTLTTNVTAPIVALGAAVFKVGTDFDTTMRQIVALTDTTADEIGDIREAILGLSGEVGKTPQELAEGFYFLASAGFETNEALEVLNATAKASATGLGTTADISKVVGAAINAFGKDNLTATDAVDQLIRAVKDGTAEAPEFAGALGGVLGSAGQIGATFADATAAIAAMTLKGISADEAATSLNQVFVSLIKTTPQAEEALSALGLSSDGLRKQLREKGLLSVLQTLSERFAGNETAAAAVFGNIRALRGILALTTGDASKTAAVFEDVANGTTTLADAFAETEGPGRAFDRALARVQVALISLGEDVLPVVADVLEQVSGAISAIAGWFKGLPGPVRSAVVQFLALAAAAGPVLFVAGKLTSGLGQLIGLFTKLGVAAKVAGPLLAQGMATAIEAIPGSGPVKTAASKAGTAIGKLLATPIGKAAAVGAAAFLLLEVVNEYNRQKAGHEAQLQEIGSDIADQITQGTTDQLKQSRAAVQTAIEDLLAKIGTGGFLTGPMAFLSQDVLKGLLGQLAELDAELARRAEQTGQLPRVIADRLERGTPGVATASDALGDAIAGGFVKGAYTADNAVKDTIKSILDTLRGARGDLASAASDAADEVFGPQIAKARLAATEREISEAKQTIASKKATAEQIQDARDRLVELNATKIEQLAILAGYGDQAARDTILAWARATIATKTASTEQIAAARRVIEAFDDWRSMAERLRSRLAAIVGLSREQIIQRFSTSPTGSVPESMIGVSMQHGGTLGAGQVAWVGEVGPELFVPSVPGTIIPHDQSMALASSGGGDTYNIDVKLPTTARPDPFETARQLRRLASMGILTIPSRPAEPN